MRQLRSVLSVRRAVALLALTLPVGALAGCGGGGHGFSVPANPIVITSAVLPAVNSGEVVNYLVPFTGGAGGPYILDVVDGVIPAGVEIDNGTVALTGRILEDGEYDFTLKLTDTGANPFAFTTQHYHWSVGKGALVFATDATLPSYIYNRFDTVDLIVAGGTSPYACEVVDVPALADELLPTGLSIPNSSTQIVGAPIGVKGAAPFVYTVSIKATDSTIPVPLTVIKQFTLIVLVPDVVITTTSLPNGTCGQAYTSKIQIVDGIAPFIYNVVDAIGSSNKLVGEIGSPGGVAKATGLSAYAIDTDASATYTGKFPEGVYLRDAAGDILGLPRRKGSFANWNFHIQSSVLPALASQNKWKAFSFTMLDSVPANVALNNADLLSGNAYGTANNIFQGPELTKNYSKQFTALNGCPQDGKYDGPHESQALTNPAESVNRYDFSATTFASGVPAGMTFSSTGLFAGVPAVGSSYQNVTITVEDSQLPLPRSAAHKASGTARFEIGPDTVVITETNQSSSATVIDSTIEANSQTVEILQPYSSGPVVRALASTDMAETQTHPISGGTLAGSLSAIDFLRVSVNPTWWAYDGLGSNPKSARQMQHGDPERHFRYENFGSSYSYNTSTSNYYGYVVPSTYQEGREHASNPAIEIPTTNPTSPVTVTHNAAAGVYTNGGLLYAYDKSGEFGFFVVRKDGKIYIPYAHNKGTYSGMGDAWLVTGQTRGGQMRMPQITVSPDGRMAAAKLKPTVDNFAETASTEAVVVFSLTGEKMFGGSTYVILAPGGSGNTADGQYLYGSSLTLSNFGLYALRGNNIGTATSTSGDRVVFGEHWVYRATIFSPSTGAYLSPSSMSLLALSGGTNIGDWTNTSGSPVSCCFQRWSSPGSSATLSYGSYAPYYSLNTGNGQYYDGPYSSLQSQTSSGASVTSISPCFFVYHWANFFEKGGAPHPFRVSADGRACAIIGGANQSASVAPSTFVAGFLNRSVYVDYMHTFREAATTVRRYLPPSRSLGHILGETYSQQYGFWNGPGTQFEISDDGTKLAAVYNASTAAWSSHPVYARMGYSQYDYAAREELCYMNGTNGGTDPWASKSELLPTSTKIYSTLLWRLGNLAFTRDGSAIVFYGGFSVYKAGYPYYYYQYPNGMYGTLYSWSTSSQALQSILSSSDGGSTDNSGSGVTYTSGSPAGNGFGSQNNSYNVTWGRIRPKNSFISSDGNFLYVCSHDALSTSDYTSGRLVGVNIKDSSTTVSGRAPLRAFAPTWPTKYAFQPEIAYYYSYYQTQMLFGAGGGSCTVGSHQCGSNGIVYYSSHQQGLNGGSSTYQSTNSPGPSYYMGGQAGPSYYYGSYTSDSYGGQVFALDVNHAGTPKNISTSLSVSGEYREISYIQPSADGTRVAYVTILRNTSAYYQSNPSQEKLFLSSGLSSSATTGAVTVGGDLALETTAGRVGSSIALDSTGTRVYYGFCSGGSNENAMVLVEKSLNTTGTAVTGTRTFNGVSNTTNRFAVLWSGR